jgi:hypothetical protein
VSNATLKVDSKGEALVTDTKNGATEHVLA